jgi:uncharacterized delta-60 repeat protein
MTRSRLVRLIALLAQLPLVSTARPQAPFDLDVGFRTDIQKRYVASVAPMPDGSLLLSGMIRVTGGISDRGSAKLLPDGSFDFSFPAFPQTIGGGRITPWLDRYYIGTTQTVRRLDPSGLIDPSFISMNMGPYFLSLQGGDYHVYPDGRVLMSGAHVLSDSIRGFEGLYSLIWFSNEGYLDTTRTHRLCNGVIYAIKEQPDGRILCTGTMTTYEGQPVSRVFRVEADGTLDLGFVAPLQPLGEARSYFMLPDGRIMIGGSLRLLDSPQVRSLIRLHSDGSLYESFNLLDFEATFTPSQIPNISSIYQLSNDRFIVTGLFDKVNGMDRGGIAMIDSTGNLVMDVFDGMGCGAYQYVVPSGSTTYKSIAGIVPSNDGGYFIYGAYHGYDDGTTNDTTQRMVSKLYGLNVGVREESPPLLGFRLYPNPACMHLTVELDALSPGTELVLRDALGRAVLRQRIGGNIQTVQVGNLPSGFYSAELLGSCRPVAQQRLVVAR